jgi:hypothetical protein
MTELGRVTASFAQAEAGLRAVLGELMNPATEVGDAVCSHVSFRRSLDLLASLVRHACGEGVELSFTLDLIDRAGRAADRRNSLIHCEWWTTVSPGDDRHGVTRRRIRARGKAGLTYEWEKMEPEDLRAAAEEIEEVSRGFADLYAHLRQSGFLTTEPLEWEGWTSALNKG